MVFDKSNTARSLLKRGREGTTWKFSHFLWLAYENVDKSKRKEGRHPNPIVKLLYLEQKHHTQIHVQVPSPKSPHFGGNTTSCLNFLFELTHFGRKSATRLPMDFFFPLMTMFLLFSIFHRKLNGGNQKIFCSLLQRHYKQDIHNDWWNLDYLFFTIHFNFIKLFYLCLKEHPSPSTVTTLCVKNKEFSLWAFSSIVLNNYPYFIIKKKPEMCFMDMQNGFPFICTLNCCPLIIKYHPSLDPLSPPHPHILASLKFKNRSQQKI